MTANEVIALAKVGELSQLSPAIKDDVPTLVGFINLGLIEIYKRFPLKTDEALITLVASRSIYTLDGLDTQVEMGEPYFYLQSAFGESPDAAFGMASTALPINSEDNIYSVNTIGHNKVQIPLVTDGSMISLIYVSKPNKVTVANLATELDMPDHFVEPLLHYLGYRGHGAMDGNIQAESNTHYMRFEASCNRMKELGVGLAPDDIDMNSRLSTRGFV